MFRKTALLILTVLLSSSIAFAGEIIEISCDKCGFKRGTLPNGCGMLGIENTIIYCEKCKDFYAIPTEIAFETNYSKNFKLIESTGKKEFLGQERLVYPCPKCGSGAFAYRGPVCPICKEGKLKIKTTGDWD